MPESEAIETIQSDGLIKPSKPEEATMAKLAKMSDEAKILKAKSREDKDKKIVLGRVKILVASYIIDYLTNERGLAVNQIYSLGADDFNRMPEVIYSDRQTKVWFLGWFPALGWIFAYKYLKFRSGVKFLRSLNTHIVDQKSLSAAYEYMSCSILGLDHYAERYNS